MSLRTDYSTHTLIQPPRHIPDSSRWLEINRGLVVGCFALGVVWSAWAAPLLPLAPSPACPSLLSGSERGAAALLMAPCIVRHGSCLVVQGPTSLLPVGGKPLKHTVLSFYTMYR